MPRRYSPENFWSRPEVRRLEAKHRALLRYLYDQADTVGVYVADPEIASIHIGCTVTEADLDSLQPLVEKKNNLYWIKSFLSDTYGNLDTNSPIHERLIEKLEASGFRCPNKKLKSSKPTKPKFDEYCTSVGISQSDGDHLWSSWEDNGWCNGKTGKPIKDWRAMLRNYKKHNWLPSQKLGLNVLNAETKFTRSRTPNSNGLKEFGT